MAKQILYNAAPVIFETIFFRFVLFVLWCIIRRIETRNMNFRIIP